MSLPHFVHGLTRVLRRGIFVALAAASVAPAIALAAGEISQGYTISGNATAVSGTLVTLASATNNTVSPAISDHANQLLGVVGDASLIQIGGNKQVQVITSGLTNALVSDINGKVKTGDKITASPLTGIGMKATSAGEVVGTAQSNLTETDTTSQSITDKSGKKTTVHVGRVPLQVDVSYFATSDDRLTALVPPFLLSLGGSIAGHEVSPLRVLGGIFALLLGFITVAVMLQSAVHSGIIAIGRNPLAQGALRKGMLEIVVTAIGILGLTVVVIYIVLIA